MFAFVQLIFSDAMQVTEGKSQLLFIAFRYFWFRIFIFADIFFICREEDIESRQKKIIDALDFPRHWFICL